MWKTRKNPDSSLKYILITIHVIITTIIIIIMIIIIIITKAHVYNNNTCNNRDRKDFYL